jgi:hypothetical protein
LAAIFEEWIGADASQQCTDVEPESESILPADPSFPSSARVLGIVFLLVVFFGAVICIASGSDRIDHRIAAWNRSRAGSAAIAA